MTEVSLSGGKYLAKTEVIFKFQQADTSTNMVKLHLKGSTK